MVKTNYNGILLSKECDVEDIVKSLEKLSFFKNKSTRDNAYNVFLENYNAKDNYESFIMQWV